MQRNLIDDSFAVLAEFSGVLRHSLTAGRHEDSDATAAEHEIHAKCREECRELRQQLDQLDEQHETALQKVLQLKQRSDARSEAAERRLAELESRLADDWTPSVTSAGKREEPEGAPLEETIASQRKEELSAELSRLRRHLLDREDNETRLSQQWDERERALRDKCRRLEEECDELRARDRRHADEVRAVRTEREMARVECSRLEDRVGQSSASVANLQLVVEHIQRQNERSAQETQRKTDQLLDEERRRTQTALEALRREEERARQTAEALGAAARLSAALDAKEAALDELRAEVGRKDALCDELRAQMVAKNADCEGKVDKQVVKSLVIGYFCAPEDKRPEVERLLARVLDFNQQEMDKSGVQIGRKRPEDDSLSRKFVQFLESESKPAANPTTSANRTEVARNLSKSLIQSTQRSNPFLTSMTPSVGHSRQSSVSSMTSSQDGLNQLLCAPSVVPFAPLLSPFDPNTQ